MNHDMMHCGDYCDECPKDCYRGQLTEELKHIDYPWPVCFGMLKGTEYCPKWPKKDANRKD